jgi:stress-induced morphogen
LRLSLVIKPGGPHIFGTTTESGETAMAMAAHEIEKRIIAAIPDAKVEIRDLAGDGDHYAATVISETFRGKSRVQQHQMVNAACGADMGTVRHSLALQTKAPD